MENARLGQKVVLVFHDETGIGNSVLQSLDKGPSSSWERLRSPLRIPMKSYGIPDADVCGDLVTFTDAQGLIKVSLILVKGLCSATNVYTAHAVLEFVMEKAPVQASEFALIIVSATVVPSALLNDKGISDDRLHAAFLNEASDGQRDLFRGLPTLPPTMRMGNEFLACLLHLVQVLGIPSVLLMFPIAKVTPLYQRTEEEKDKKLQIVQLIGNCLAKQLGLSFPKCHMNGISDTATSMKNVEREEWRSLYM